MTTVCYSCHTNRTDIVKVAEDAQQIGYEAMRGGDEDKAVARYKQAAKILSEIPNLRCKRHVPPLFCVSTRGREFDGDWVWLPSVFGTHVTICEGCFRKRPCIDCDTVAANPAWANARPWSGLYSDDYGDDDYGDDY